MQEPISIQRGNLSQNVHNNYGNNMGHVYGKEKDANKFEVKNTVRLQRNPTPTVLDKGLQFLVQRQT